MTKKLKNVDKKDLRKSQLGALIWLCVIGGIALLLSVSFILRESSKGNQNTENQQGKTTTIQMETTKGTIQMVIEDSKMPKTSTHFEKLVSENFYTDLLFHRVEDWVMQGGDPTRVGKQELKETIPLETHPDLTHKRGAIGMARTPDPNSATSQFYIVKKDMHQIDGQYAIFGNVVSGMDVVDKIEIGDKIISAKIIK